jgi:phosphoadenosine phosphosulfate reductase
MGPMTALAPVALPRRRSRRAARIELAEALDAPRSEDAAAVVAWAVEHFGGGLALVASFQDCVLIDVATRVAPDVEVVFLDTQYHFPETLDYVETVRRRYALRLTVARPLVDPDDRWRDDLDGCCAARKVEPLDRALSGHLAWMSGVRRVETAGRASTQVVERDARRGLVKVNPLAAWTDADVAAYVREHDLPRHPLKGEGYGSIGCWPCTRPVGPGEHSRSGRWAGSDKTECGLHAAADDGGAT